MVVTEWVADVENSEVSSKGGPKYLENTSVGGWKCFQKKEPKSVVDSFFFQMLPDLLSKNLGSGFPKADDNQPWWEPDAGTAKTRTLSLCGDPHFCTKNQAKLALLFMFYGAW